MRESTLLTPFSAAVDSVVQAAQQRVTAEWQQFEQEAAKTEDWKREQQKTDERQQQHLTATVTTEDPLAEAASAPPRRLVFSIDDDALDSPTVPTLSLIHI